MERPNLFLQVSIKFLFGGCCHLLSKDMADPSPSSSSEILFMLLFGIAFWRPVHPAFGWVKPVVDG